MFDQGFGEGIEKMIEKLGARDVAKAFLKAAELAEALSKEAPDGAVPMTAKDLRELMEASDSGSDAGILEEGEEEDMQSMDGDEEDEEEGEDEVRWSAGPLVRWSASLLLCWSAGPLVFWSAGPQEEEAKGESEGDVAEPPAKKAKPS